MKRRSKSISLCGRCVFLIVFGMISTGCGYPDKQPSYLAPVAHCSDCFKLVTVGSLGPFQPKERIRAIRLVKRQDLCSEVEEICWEVVADKPVLAEGFSGVVGEIPEQFHQTVPKPSEMFRPVPGERYYIAVSFAHPLAMPWVYQIWTAEQETRDSRVLYRAGQPPI